MAEPLTVHAFVPGEEAEWERAVGSASNGTVFHRRRFLAYHPTNRFSDASFTLARGDRLVGVVPGAWVEDDELGRGWSSHPGASYGGPAFVGRPSGRTVVEAVEALVKTLRDDAAWLQMRLPPHALHRAPALEALEFALHLHGFEVSRSELSTFAALEDDDVLASLSPSCRRNIRKAERAGLVAEESNDLDQYWEILTDNLARGYGVTPTHERPEIERLRDLLPGDVRLFATHDGVRMVAGVLVFVINEWSAHTFYMASREDAQPTRPLNLALYEALRWARARGLRRMNFGVSTPRGRYVNWGLLRFKETFGGHNVVRNTYRLRIE